MKQMLAILLTAALILTVSACGSKAESGTPTDTAVFDTSPEATTESKAAPGLTDEESALFDTSQGKVIYATGDGIYEAFTFDGDTIVKYELINEFASAAEAQAYRDMICANGVASDKIRIVGRFVVTDATAESREAFDGYSKDEILGEYASETAVSAPVPYTDAVTDAQTEAVTSAPMATDSTTSVSEANQPPRGENALPDLNY